MVDWSSVNTAGGSDLKLVFSVTRNYCLDRNPSSSVIASDLPVLCSLNSKVTQRDHTTQILHSRDLREVSQRLIISFAKMHSESSHSA